MLAGASERRKHRKATNHTWQSGLNNKLAYSTSFKPSGQAGRPSTEANEFIQTALDEALVRTRRNALVVHEILRRSCGCSWEKTWGISVSPDSPISTNITSYRTSNGISGSFESFPFLCFETFLGASPPAVLRFFAGVGAISLSLEAEITPALVVGRDCWHELITTGLEQMVVGTEDNAQAPNDIWLALATATCGLRTFRCSLGN